MKILYKKGFPFHRHSDLLRYARAVLDGEWRNENDYRKIRTRTLACGRIIWVVCFYDMDILYEHPQHILMFEDR